MLAFQQQFTTLFLIHLQEALAYLGIKKATSLSASKLGTGDYESSNDPFLTTEQQDFCCQRT